MKIKNIFVTGGSQCIAGGFIWDDVKKIYHSNNITINNNLDVAYPTLLGKMLNVDVINEGAPGGSITRLIRKTYEFIFSNNCNETLFVLEIPPGWRDEFYSTEFKRYFNITIGSIYSPNDDTDVACGNNPNDLRNLHKDVSNYFYNFVDDKLHLEKTMLNLLGLLSYLKLNNYKYLLIDTGDFETYLQRKHQPTDYNFVWFSEDYSYPMWEWADKEKLLIKDETIGKSRDEHMGIEANELVANKLYKLIINENQTPIS
jgi:hypothetical protein